MFTSEYEHTIDAKSRMFIPAKYREIVGTSVYLCKSLTDKCLYFMTVGDWEEYKNEALERLTATKDRRALRLLFSSVTEVPLDSQGRILIPQNYMEYASLSEKAVIVGSGKRAEIWAPDLWREYLESCDMKEIEDVLSDKGL